MNTPPQLPTEIEQALKPLYVSGSMDVFNLRVAIEKELHTLEQKHRAEVEDYIGLGYSLATEKLFTPFEMEHAYIEKILERPVLTQVLGELKGRLKE